MHGTIATAAATPPRPSRWRRLLRRLELDPRPWEAAGIAEREWIDHWAIR